MEETCEPLQPLAQQDPDFKGNQSCSTSSPPESCYRCHKPLGPSAVGQTLEALGNSYHIACFSCRLCGDSLANGGAFFQHSQKDAYAEANDLCCERCFREDVAPRCAGCEQGITEKCVVWEDERRWHFGCFRCTICRAILNPEPGGLNPYYRHRGDPACAPCKRQQMEAEAAARGRDKCFRCRRPIEQNEKPFIWHLQKYHAHHFKCTECDCQLKPDTLYDWEGKFYCEDHYIQLKSPTCYSCKEIILGRFVTGLGLTFHPEHFVCSKCQCEFKRDEFFEHEGVVLCPVHFREATGKFCHYCSGIIDGRVMEYGKQLFCAKHFFCVGCGLNLSERHFGEWDGRPMCYTCFGSLPFRTRYKISRDRVTEKKLRRKRRELAARSRRS